jgi:hypothetical protein
MQFLIADTQTSCLVSDLFRRLPARERKHVESKIAAITNSDLVTAVRPFMFGGRVVHELYFDPFKLMFFTRQEKIGAVISAFAIASLAHDGAVPLSDQALRTHTSQIIRYGRSLKHGTEISAFLRRLRILEDDWRKGSDSLLSREHN